MKRRNSLMYLPLMVAALAVVQVVSPRNCVGQEPAVSTGDRIRVKPLVRPKDRLTGSFISAANDTLSFESRSEIRRLALSDIKTLELSTGEKSHLAGTLFGVIGGAFVGGLLGAVINKALDDHCSEYCGWTGGFIGLIAGGIGGGFAGYHWLAHEQWVNVPVADLRVSIGAGIFRIPVGR